MINKNRMFDRLRIKKLHQISNLSLHENAEQTRIEMTVKDALKLLRFHFNFLNSSQIEILFQ